MRKTALCCCAIAAALNSAPVAAQAWIGQALLPMNQKPSSKCYDPNMPQKAEVIADRQSRADTAIHDYLALAATNTDLRAAFVDRRYGRWLLDGADQPLQSARDPWAARVANIENIGFAVSNQSIYEFRGAWAAFATDGSTLGYYEAFLQRAGKGHGAIFVLKLTSPTAPPPKVTRYCRYPRDIEDPGRR